MSNLLSTNNGHRCDFMWMIDYEAMSMILRVFPLAAERDEIKGKKASSSWKASTFSSFNWRFQFDVIDNYSRAIVFFLNLFNPIAHTHTTPWHSIPFYVHKGKTIRWTWKILRYITCTDLPVADTSQKKSNQPVIARKRNRITAN